MVSLIEIGCIALENKSSQYIYTTCILQNLLDSFKNIEFPSL